MYVFLRTTTSNSTPTFRRPVSVCKPVFLWGAKVSFSSLIEKKGVFKIYFVNTVLQFAKSLKQNYDITMTDFKLSRNCVLIFIYFYHLGQTARTSTRYFLNFPKVARFEIHVEVVVFARANFAL